MYLQHQTNTLPPPLLRCLIFSVFTRSFQTFMYVFRAVVAILKLLGPGPYTPKKSGGARPRFYPISAKKWGGPGQTGPYSDSSPDMISTLQIWNFPNHIWIYITYLCTVEARDSGFARLQQNVYYLGRSTISEVSWNIMMGIKLKRNKSPIATNYSFPS